MTSAERTEKPWDTGAYGRIVDARLQDGEIVLLFGDQTWTKASPQELLPDAEEPRWDRMTFSEFEIAVPTAEGIREISWFSVRLATDNAFASYIDDVARERDRRNGHYIAEQRRARDLTVKDLASQAGLDPHVLAQVEKGVTSISLPDLRRVLESMNLSFRDLRLAVDKASPDASIVTDPASLD